MKVLEGLSFELPDSSWCKPEIELGDTDFESIMAEWGLTPSQVSDISVLNKYKILSAVARQLLVVRQVQAMSSNQSWMETEGRALLTSVSQALKALHTLVTSSP